MDGIIAVEDFIPEYIDKEPAAFMGVSMSELVGLILKSFLILFPLLSIILVILFNNLAFIALAFLLSLGLSVVYTKVKAAAIREESKGRPNCYTRHRFEIRIELFRRKHFDSYGEKQFFHTVPDGLWGR